MFYRSILPICTMAGWAAALGGCVSPEIESSGNPSNSFSAAASSSVRPVDAGVADAAAPGGGLDGGDDRSGWVRIQVGRPLRNPDNRLPTISDDNKAFVLDGMAYLCPTRPVVSRNTGRTARIHPWTVSIDDCQSAPEEPEEALNRSFLREKRGMKRPYAVDLGEPLTAPYTPKADDAESLSWTIRPHVDPAGNIYIVSGEEEGDHLYCPKIPDVRLVGTGTIVRGHRTYTVNNYSIGTNVCVSQASVDRLRRTSEQIGKRKVERKEISGLVMKNLLIYAVAILLNLTLASFLRKDRS